MVNHLFYSAKSYLFIEHFEDPQVNAMIGH